MFTRFFLLLAALHTVSTSSVVSLSTLFPYHKRSSGNINPGSGCWWGASFAVTKHNTVLAAGEVKLETTAHEVPTQLEMKRSDDGGLTWGNATVFVSDPKNGTVFGGGSFVYSSLTDTVLFLYLGPPYTGQPLPSTEQPIFVMHSKDDGRTWSPPIRAKSKNGANVTGGELLGHGIELRHGAHTGRLVLATNEYVGPGPKSGPGYDLRTYSVFSDDAGLTWSRGSDLLVPFTPLEATVAEIGNGSLIISARNAVPRTAGNMCASGEICHTFGRSDDGGVTWAETWTVPVDRLPVHTCQPSLISTSDGSKLYFGAPMNTTTGDRWNYTIYTSLDGGREWAWATGVYGGPSGYSDMIFLPSGELAVGFQRGLGLPRPVVGGGYEMAYARVEV